MNIKQLNHKDISSSLNQCKNERSNNFLRLLINHISFSTAAAYYADFNKRENNANPKAWKSLTADEKKRFTKMLNDVSCFYSTYQNRKLSKSLG
jgi:uncharacterized lipoprotein YehR (DUF1307 family)